MFNSKISKVMRKMKFFLLSMALFAGVVLTPLFAQPDVGNLPGIVEDIVGQDVVWSISTFMGIVSVISVLVTQIAKQLPVIAVNTLLKIFVSVAVGIAVSLLAWYIGVADFLTGLLWWQVIIQGLIAGFTACGIIRFNKDFFVTALRRVLS
jgi:small-conductance mechanosensitive channel